jgi:hypothetical protein
MATPLIKRLQVQGGTFYTFTSSADDISKTFTDDNTRFVFSRFACLNLPDVSTPTNQLNNVVWEAIGNVGSTSTTVSASSSTDQNINLAQSFQNYALNIEQLILEGKNDEAAPYNNDLQASVSERIFWKWLGAINAVRYQNATTDDTSLSDRFKEESSKSTGTQQYQRVVEYLGEIDLLNTVTRDGHSYTELYLHIPTSHGNTPTVLWKSYSDDNYRVDLKWNGTSEYIDGRTSTSVHPDGLSMLAYYDNDLLDRYESKLTFSDVTNTTTTTDTSKPILVSNLDGIVLDWDPESYKDITTDPTRQYLPQYNTDGKSNDFEFNCALVYYDIYNQSNPNDRFTDLYGILILDDYVNSVDGGSLKSYQKFKPNKITKLNGNSYGLKLNIKFDTSVDNVGVETIINEYNTFSMDLFMDASTRLNDISDMFSDQQFILIDQAQRITTLEKFYFTQDTIDEINLEISNLQSLVNNATIALQDPSTIIDLVSSNSDSINAILAGTTPLSLTYNLDVIDFGDGISIDDSVPNKVKIGNTRQGVDSFSTCLNTNSMLSYDIDNGLSFNITDIDYPTKNNLLTLSTFTNYFKVENPTGDLDYDLRINIDDTTTNWKTGQKFRISFENQIDLATNAKKILIYTDSTDRFNNGKFNTLISSIESVDLESTKPIIEIICRSENTYEFYIDVIK